MEGKKKALKYIIVMLFMFLTALLTVNMSFDKMRYTKIPQDNESLGIKEDTQSSTPDNQGNTSSEDISNNQAEVSDDDLKTEKGGNKKTEEEVKKGTELDSSSQQYKLSKIINIALLGGDRRQKNEASHTDVVMILTVDGVHNKIKLSSIMRDTYVNVYGHGKTKLTHAYAYGGPLLTIRTLNENFNLNIRNFVFIDFNGFEKLVDSLNGIEIEVKQHEIKEINKYIKEIASLKKQRYTPIKKAGIQNLNGQQALAYSRIRYVGNGDFERTERQRKVLNAIFQKIKSAGPLEYPSIAAGILSYIETNMKKTDIIKLGMNILSSDIGKIEEQRFPMDGCYKNELIDNMWYIVTNINTTRRQMHKFIYEK